MKLIQRDLYLNQLISRKENGLIKIVTGIRRSGKSYLLFKIFYNHLLECGVKEENIITLALDDDLNREYRNPDKLSEFLYSKITNKTETFYILLDEIQFAISDKELKGKEPIRIYGILNGLLRLDNVDIYVTGSNSKFLSSDIMTEFRGRGDEVRVFPLSFAEFYSSNQFVDKYEAWNEYSRYGGLPMLLTKKTDDEKIKYLKDLLTKTYIQDVIERNHLKGDVVIGTLVDILASSTGSLTNPTKLANTFNSNNIKTTDKTISTYIDYLTDAFMISKVQRYNIKGKKYINSPFKFYFSDMGLRNASLNFRELEQPRLMENIVYNELVMRGYNVDAGVVELYEKNDKGKSVLKKTEVDFVCNQADKRYYIQVAYAIDGDEKINQEQKTLLHIKNAFKKIIIVKDAIRPHYNNDGVYIIGLYDFLLNENILNF